MGVCGCVYVFSIYKGIYMDGDRYMYNLYTQIRYTYRLLGMQLEDPLDIMYNNRTLHTWALRYSLYSQSKTLYLSTYYISNDIVSGNFILLCKQKER